MKSTKKVMSVVLSVLMILSTVTCSFVAFAAAKGVTAAQYQALADAVKNETVAQACAAASGSANSYTIKDPDGSVLAAADAYWAVVNGLYDSAANQNNTTTRNLGLMKTQIVQNLQNGGYITAGEVAQATSIINAFACNTNVPTKTGITSSSSATQTTVTLKVDCGEAAILKYASIADMPDTIVTSRTYTTSHSRANAGSTWSPKYYVKISKLATTDTTAKKSDFVAYQTTFAQYDEIYAKDLDALVAMGSTNLGNAKKALNDAYTAVAGKFSDEVFEKFYGDYAAKVEAIIPLIDKAVEIIPYVTIAEKITELCATDFSEYNATQLTTLESNIKTQLTNYNKASAETKAYVEGKGYVDLANAQETLTAVTYAKEVLKLTALKEEIDGKVDVYSAYTEAQVADGDITGAQLSAAYTEIGSYITSLGTYVEATVVEVCGENYIADLTALRAQINALIVVADYRSDFMADYEKYLNEVNSALDIPDDSEELLAAVQGYDEWYAGLKELTAKIEAELGEETANRIFTDLNDKMTAAMEAKYAALEARVTAQIEAADIIYAALYEAYGEEVTMATLASYRNLEKSVGLIEKDIIDFFAETENHDLAEATLATYAKLEAALENYAAFNQSAGFDRFETSEIADIVRKVTDKDVVRDEDYTVNDEMVEAIIKLLDKVLGSDEIKDILGLDLKGTLTGLLDKIYTNDLINTVVQYVYPLVAEQFVNIWASGLPTTVPTTVSGIDVTVTVTYKSIEDAMKNIKFYVLPQILGEHIAKAYPSEQFTSAAAQLQQVTTSAYDRTNDVVTNTWEDSAICDEEGKLTLDWGVTDRETFLNAAEAALSGLEPLLLALLSNVSIVGDHENEPDHEAYITEAGSAGHGLVATGIANALNFANVPVDAINLYLDVKGNSGYNNALVPIFEALGMENLPDGDTLTSTRSLLDEGLLKPVEAFLEKLAANPVETIITALPNIAYAVEAGMVVPILKMLKTDIFYHADAHQQGYKLLFITIAEPGWVGEALSDGPISINIGEMINLEEMGLDVSSLNGILSLVSGLLGVELPAIDGIKLASLGTLTQKATGRNEKTYTWGEDGKAAYIEANKADVLLFILDYVLDALKDEDFLKGIIAAINSSDDVEDPEKAEEVVTVEIPEIVKEIIKNVTTNKGDAIAAIAELIMPKKYADANGDINWLEGVDAPEAVYTNGAWTRDKALFVAKNFPNTVNNILKIAGVKIDGVKTEDLAATVDALLNKLYTADNVNAIANAISGLFAGADLDEKIVELVKALIDVDLTYWDNFSVSFEDGDKDAFFAGLTSVLEPLTGLLKFVICGEDFKATVTNGGKIDVITLKGYDSYTNGIIPLLEVLGSTKVMTPDEFKADSDNIVSNLIASVVSVIDNIQADPYNKVLDLVLNVVYFVASDGVQVVVDNVLHGIDAVLDTIRPIYDININELIGMDIRFAESDPLSFLFVNLQKMIYDETGVDLALDLTAKQVYENLAFADRVVYTSANGKTAYKITADSNSAADIVTVVGRYLVAQLVAAENSTKLADLAKDKFELDDVTYEILFSLLVAFSAVEDGPDYILALAFYIFFGADNALDAVADYYKYYAYDWAAIIKMLQNSDATYAQKAAYVLKQVYEKTFSTIFDEIADNNNLPIHSEDIKGFPKLFASIIETLRGFFEAIRDFFQSLGK